MTPIPNLQQNSINCKIQVQHIYFLQPHHVTYFYTQYYQKLTPFNQIYPICPMRPCLNELQKEYCMKTKVIALD